MVTEYWEGLSLKKKLELMTKARDGLVKKVTGLENDLRMFYALEAAGVDKWEGYEIALGEIANRK